MLMVNEQNIIINYTGGDGDEHDACNWREDIFKNMHIQQVNFADDVSEHNTEGVAATNEDNIGEDIANGSQLLTEEEIEDFIEGEQKAASEGNNTDTDCSSKYTSQIGMEFNDKDNAHHFFCFYGFLAGFEVVTTHNTRTTSRKRNGEVVKVEMKFIRHGRENSLKKPQEDEPPILEGEDIRSKGQKEKLMCR
jgi:hypothetical protein